MTPKEYVLSNFRRYDIVFIGEEHYIKQNLRPHITHQFLFVVAGLRRPALLARSRTRQYEDHKCKQRLLQVNLLVKGGVKPDHWGGVKVDQLYMQEIGDFRGGGRLERRPAPPARRRV